MEGYPRLLRVSISSQTYNHYTLVLVGYSHKLCLF